MFRLVPQSFLCSRATFNRSEFAFVGVSRKLLFALGRPVKVANSHFQVCVFRNVFFALGRPLKVANSHV